MKFELNSKHFEKFAQFKGATILTFTQDAFKAQCRIGGMYLQVTSPIKNVTGYTGKTIELSNFSSLALVTSEVYDATVEIANGTFKVSVAGSTVSLLYTEVEEYEQLEEINDGAKGKLDISSKYFMSVLRNAIAYQQDLQLPSNLIVEFKDGYADIIGVSYVLRVFVGNVPDCAMSIKDLLAALSILSTDAEIIVNGGSIHFVTEDARAIVTRTNPVATFDTSELYQKGKDEGKCTLAKSLDTSVALMLKLIKVPTSVVLRFADDYFGVDCFTADVQISAETVGESHSTGVSNNFVKFVTKLFRPSKEYPVDIEWGGGYLCISTPTVILLTYAPVF